MKKLFFTLITLFILSSCVTVEFTSPQPSNKKSLKKFPKEIRGSYQVRILSESDGEPEEPSSDRIIIADHYYQEQSEATLKDQVHLSDSCILKPFRNNHFINFKGKNETYWTVALLELTQEKNIKVYGLFAGEDMEEEAFIEALNAITPVHKMVHEDGEAKYDISPSNEELSRLVDEHYFKPVYELIRISE